MGAAEAQCQKIHHSHLIVFLALKKGVTWVISRLHQVQVLICCEPRQLLPLLKQRSGGQQHQKWSSPLCFQVFSIMSLNIYPISNLVLVWNLWGTCIIQGTKFRPQFLVADLESLQSSHKILVSLKSHSESRGPIQDLKRGQVKMVGGVPGSEQGQGKELHLVSSSFQGQFSQDLL